MTGIPSLKKSRFRRRRRFPSPSPALLLLLIGLTILAATYQPQLAQYVPRVEELVPPNYLRLSTSKAQRSTSQPRLPSAIVGRASVIDGDTIEIHGARIRFYGIDAPESNQICYANGKTNRCGQRAAMALAGEIGNHVVSCAPKDRDKYGRTVAVCRVDDTDLNAWMVRNGWALAYRQYSTAYIPDENQAKQEKAGIWQGNFTAPWDWRHGSVSPQAPSLGHSSARTNVSCLIKGNINRRGQHIYHLPGQEYYSRTIITASKGERWFCTEGEARAAGWRRSMR